ncbi:ABC transporter substrate-binding protein [Streptomyces sp. NPDC056983]|uniref:ABC transporter substrate-binding protein n=1 Tax=Streptomyces sp. NPDC056983 TaxID=3345987 RepID=UPI0036320C63
MKAPAGYKGPYKSGDLDSIETPDAKTVVFHLKKSFPDFPSALTMPNFTPFPKGTGAKHAFDSRPISSGPYKMASYKHGASLKLFRNPKWKRSTDKIRAAKPDAFEWTFGLDAATMDERMLAGRARTSTQSSNSPTWSCRSTAPGRRTCSPRDCQSWTR